MKKASSKRRFSSFFIAGLCLLICDMLSKYWIYHHFPSMLHALPFYPYGGIGIFQNVLGIDFCINRVTNLGGAWGVFGSYPIVLLIVRIAILFGVMVFALFLNDEKKKTCSPSLNYHGSIGEYSRQFFLWICCRYVSSYFMGILIFGFQFRRYAHFLWSDNPHSSIAFP